MSATENVSAPAVEGATEPLVAPTAVEAPAAVIVERVVAAPVVEAPGVSATEAEPVVASETAPAAEETKAEAEPVAEKAVEPISEGQLAYKGPGLINSLIPSKKEFWLSDAPVEAANLDLFLRGEKPEVAHPIVAWASQTGKGLLFFNKKGDTDRTHPGDILPLYEATDLKKESQHQFSFKTGTHTHTFKATSDAERDGWYLSIEKAVELAKASKEEILASEGYKSEHEKLAAPVVASKKADEPEAEKKQKSRSTSRGLLGRLKGNKEETAEEKKEEEETKAVEPEVAPVGEVAPVIAAVPAETAVEDPVAETAATTEIAPLAEEKPKPAKRQSIFGKFSLKSPIKEKKQDEAELGAAPVSENPPVLPETAATTDAEVPAVEEPVATEAVPATTEAAPAATETASPTKEKTNFLSSFIKRSRSASPSTALKEEPKKEETAAVAPVAEEAPVAAAAAEDPVAETAATTEIAPLEETRPEPTKRESVLGSLGRRASKAFKSINAPKKDSAAATEATKEEATTEETAAVAEPEVAKTEAAPANINAEEQTAIADVVPEAVSTGQPATTHSIPVVSASA